MPDFPIDPELRIRARPPIVLRRTTEAIEFIRKAALSSPNRAWEEVLQSLEAARDEWSAMEAVVKLELLLEARDLLIEESRAYTSRFPHGHSRAA
jgi:acyl-CoA reductase-like NAD-dependent aldehyde dehydrogenase